MEVQVAVIQGACWGRLIGEDSDEGACDLCVRLCPEVFEKPEADACARVRPGADLTGNLRQILAVIESCPTDAIRLQRTPAGRS